MGSQDGDVAVWTQDVSHDRYEQTVIGWQVTHEPGENTWHINVADCVRAIEGLLIDLPTVDR